jgi:monoamine oxidase
MRHGSTVARTPLLSALQRLAEEHRTAAQLRMEPDELRGQRAEVYPRREFLKRAGVAGAAVTAVSPNVLGRPARGGHGPQIAIVGGGIAGLSAALTLADKGVDSTIYEASPDRVGGRMHSDTSGYWSSSQVSEFCGELIDTGHTTIRGLARRFHLDVDDLIGAEPKGSDDTNWFLGSYYGSKQIDADFKPINATLQDQVNAAGYPTTWNSSTPAGQGFDAMSVHHWIDTYVPGGHTSAMGRLLDAAYNEEYGAETTDQSSLNLIYLLGFQPKHSGFAVFGQSDERFHIAGGNQQLPEAIADHIGRRNIQLGWAMQSIARNTDGTITMTFATPGGNETVTADHVILCMSFAVLRTLDYSGASFDLLKKTAITGLGAGRNAKLQLQFASRYWNTRGPWGVSNGSVYSDIGIQNAWDVTRAQRGKTGILVDYSGGALAGALTPPLTPYSNASDPQVALYATAFLQKLEPIFPGITSQWNGKATLSTPFLDPLLKCSYSYWQVGQYTSFAGYEGVAQGNIHFAGEHCSQDFQGFMEGGASEGVRAAGEILAALKKK